MHFSEATGFEINGENNKEDLANLASFKGLCLHNLEKQVFYNQRSVDLQIRYQKAIEQFTLAIALDPKASDHYGARAVVHRSLGNLEEAQRDLEKELELELNESDAEELLVEAEFELKCRM